MPSFWDAIQNLDEYKFTCILNKVLRTISSYTYGDIAEGDKKGSFSLGEPIYHMCVTRLLHAIKADVRYEISIVDLAGEQGKRGDLWIVAPGIHARMEFKVAEKEEDMEKLLEEAMNESMQRSVPGTLSHETAGTMRIDIAVVFWQSASICKMTKWKKPLTSKA